jgi:methionine sulfoxide reductase heme-binding subunit
VNTAVVSGPSPRSALRALQGWRLFWVLAVTASVIELLAWQTIDWRSGTDVRTLIGFNWRLSALYFLLTFTASALQQLFPSMLTRWLLANRRYFGLAFASVAGWQLVTILILSTRFRPELEDIHSESFQYVEDLIFVVLVLMTVTSFRPVSRHLRPATWRRLHSTGIYLLGGLFTVNFLDAAVNATDTTYLVIISAFALAWGLRLAVWWRRRGTFAGWKLFRALFGFANAGILGTWSYFGLQPDQHLRYVTAVCTALSCLFFLAALLGPSLHQLRPGVAGAKWLAGRRYYLLAGLLSMAWYLAFMAVRAGKPAGADAPPLPLGAGVALAIVAAALVMLGRGSERAGAGDFPGANRTQRFAALALATVLAGGLLVTRHEAVSAVLAVPCLAAWVVALVAALQPARRAAPTTS